MSHLDVVQPFVSVRASTTKNHKAATIWLHPEVVVALSLIKQEIASEGDKVFLRFPRIERFKRDLVKASVVYANTQGHVADFHSLRKTFGTNLAKGGVPRRVATSALRHSEGNLTDNIYTDLGMLNTFSILGVLPTYTAGLSQGVSQTLGASGLNASSAVIESVRAHSEKMPVNINESHLVAPNVTSGHDGEIGGSDGARIRNLCRDRGAYKRLGSNGRRSQQRGRRLKPAATR